MNLKRVEMIGFKSFADKTKIEFYDGVTGIVGPNGSGKSNVADAIRWVLGEQKSKNMRGTSMQDVIFHGTKARNQLSYCEVNLVFDNSNRMFDIDYEEVVVSRKLYRSGESNYYLNKMPCRLKDITSMLHNTGLGKDGYSIIGQNKVYELINSKPLDRRKIFEEAAGIGKFKESKIDTERKLSKANENLGILQNVLSELESNLTPLKKQAVAARKFLELGELCKKYEINNYIYQYDSANDQKAAIQQKIDAVTEDKNNKQSTYYEVISKFNSNNDNIEKIDVTVSELYNKKVDLNVSLERKSGETNILKERIKAIDDEIERLSNEITKNENDKSNTSLLLDEKNTLFNLNSAKIETLKENYENTRVEYSTVLEQLLTNKSNTVLSQNDILDTIDKIGDAKSNLAKYTAQKDTLTTQLAQTKIQLDSLNDKFEDDKLEEVTLSQQLQNHKDTLKIYKENEKNALLMHSVSLEKLNDIENKTQITLQNVYTLQTRLKILEDLQKDFVGYSHGVQNLLKASKINEEIKSKFEGVVASLIEVEPKFRKAIETALGSAAQNVVTKNSEDVKKLIDFLKQNNLGQATFLPITSVKRRELSEGEKRFLSAKGCLGVATDYVKCDAKYQTVINSLLGSTVICEDHNTMINMAENSRYSFRIVSLDGDIVSTTGAITGGSSKSKTSNIIGRDKEIEETKKILDKIKLEEENLKKSKEELQLEIENSNKSIKQCVELIHNSELDIAKIQESLQNISDICIDDEEQIKLSQNLVKELNLQIETLDKNIIYATEIQQSLSENKLNANENMEINQKLSEQLDKDKDVFNEKLTEIKIQITSLNSENLAIKEEILRLNNEIEDLNNLLEKLTESKTEKINNKNSLLKQIEVKYQEKGYAEIKAELDETISKISSLEDYKKQLQKNSKQLDEERTYLQNEISSLVEKINQQEIKKATVDVQLQAMEENVWKQYELTYGTCQSYREENYDLKAGIVEAERLRKEMDKLGNINHNAITDSEALQKRYDETYERIQDLLTAKDKLTEIIDTTSKDMEERFNTEFNKINLAFDKVFKELFGGGNARLVLEDPDPESDDGFERGVLIEAEPPGQKSTKLSQLSGGQQTLTGIAILFAILNLKPMPFLLLDEVDAALDDVNVARFAKYLNRFKKSTQFIVITHRKPTMELCDRLYGVTLQNTVSIVVSIQLAEALKTAEEGN